MYSFYVVRKSKEDLECKENMKNGLHHFVYLKFDTDGNNFKSILFC